jgi:hypothetical protein
MPSPTTPSALPQGSTATPSQALSGRAAAWRVAAFFAVLTLAAVMLDSLITLGMRRLQTGEQGVWNRIVAGRINAQVLISGSSRAQTHYDARLLGEQLGQSVYNIGLNGSQTDMQVARLKTYLRHNPAPRWLIHNLDAFAFQVSRGEVYDPGQYTPYLREPDLYSALARVDPNIWKSRYLPLYGYAAVDMRFGWLLGLRQWFVSESSDALIDGFKPRHAEWTGEFDRFRAANPKGVSVPIEADGLAQIEELLALCARNRIGVVLSYSPEYRPVQQMTLNRGEVFSHFEALARRHGVLLLDFSASPIASRGDYFYNSQHLNADGARAFTQELAVRLKAGPWASHAVATAQ